MEKIVIHTSHHTHAVIGTGANDPQKMDPKASRETLDHSIMYIFAVALQDGRWHHVDSYAPKRAARADTVRLWHKIETREDPEWERRYLSTDPNEMAFGGRVEVVMRDGTTLVDEMAVANAHPRGAKPFEREDYIRKFRSMTDGIITPREANRFLEVAQDVAAAEGGGTARAERRAAGGHAGSRQARDILIDTGRCRGAAVEDAHEEVKDIRWSGPVDGVATQDSRWIPTFRLATSVTGRCPSSAEAASSTQA